MPYTESSGIRIHFEVVGAGPPLILHHWTFSSLDWWSDLGYVTALKNDAQLILIDSRGHGASDKPTDSTAYALEERVRDVTQVLDHLGLPRAHFFGFSMGGWIGFGMAVHAQDRLCSLVTGGAHPFAQSMKGARDYLAIGVAQGATAFLEKWESDVGPVTPEQRERILQFKYEAMVAAARDRKSLGPYLDDIAVPCHLLTGEDDSICEQVRLASEQIPGARLTTFPGKGHGATIQDVNRVAPLVLEHIRSHPCTPWV